MGLAPLAAVTVTAAERRDGTLAPETLAAALAALRRDGIVSIREEQIGGSGGSLEPPGPLS